MGLEIHVKCQGLGAFSHVIPGVDIKQVHPLHQAVPGFERWFGTRPEVDEATRAAVLR